MKRIDNDPAFLAAFVFTQHSSSSFAASGCSSTRLVYHAKKTLIEHQHDKVELEVYTITVRFQSC